MARQINAFELLTVECHGPLKEWGYNNEVDSWLVDRYIDHSLQGLDKHYRRFDTV